MDKIDDLKLTRHSVPFIQCSVRKEKMQKCKNHGHFVMGISIMQCDMGEFNQAELKSEILG